MAKYVKDIPCYAKNNTVCNKVILLGNRVISGKVSLPKMKGHLIMNRGKINKNK